ncbi:CHRM5 [Branchiostoma lanceolatum]|uniref:CHRM5 protein n=1 Tax=Branchiostoma lanceolatum TaxID=7740 RepID=A0A8J9YLD9_BRALA|nr:CHRM5 [Branchiostoma lanceolatum]
MAVNESADSSSTCPNNESSRIDCDEGGTAMASVFSLLIFTTVLTNAAVIVVILKDKRLREVYNYLYILSLALADLSVGALGIVSCYMYYLMCTDPASCSNWKALDFLTGGVSISNLVVISVDRHHAFASPLRHHTSKKGKQRKLAILVVAWVVPIVVWTIPLGVPNSIYDAVNVVDNMPVVAVYSVLFHFLPSVVIVVLYVKILIIIQRLTMSTAKNARSPSDSTNFGDNVARPEKTRKSSDVLQGKYRGVSGPAAVGMYGRRSTTTTTMSRSSPVSRPRAATTPARTEDWPWAKRPREPAVFTITDGEITSHVSKPQLLRTGCEQPSYKKRRAGYHANFIVRYPDGDSESDAAAWRPEIVVNRPKLYAHERVLSDIRNQRRYETLMARHRRATRLLFGKIAAFIVCWIPYSIVLLLLPLESTLVGIQEVYKVTKALSYLNSTLNPLLYAFGNYDYRRALSELLCKKRRNISLALYRPSQSNVQFGPIKRIASR